MFVVGNGMIANAFLSSDYELSNCIIFASGVSNSKCSDISEFEKELELLKKYIQEKKTLIYFSTSSIYDSNKNSNYYVKHKINLEKFISSTFDKFLIYRLPNVIGKSKNNNTMINFFKESLEKNRCITIEKNSTRYFIDIDDLVRYVYLTHKNSNCILNINFNINYKIIDIWDQVCEISNKKGLFKLIDSGSSYKIDNSLFVKILGKNNIPELDDYNYLKKILKKYI